MSSPTKRSSVDQLAANLKARRLDARMSLQQVADAVGVTKGAAHGWEKGSEPEKETLDRIAALYGTTPAVLRYGEARPEPPTSRELGPAIPKDSAFRLRLRILEIQRELIQEGESDEDVRAARALLESPETARFLAGGESGQFDEVKAMRFLDGLREIIRNDLGIGKRTA